MNTTRRKQTKKEPKKQWLMAEKLLKIVRVVLCIVTFGYLFYIALAMPSPFFTYDFTDKIIGLLLPLVILIAIYWLFFAWTTDRRIRYNPYAKAELPAVIKVRGLNDKVFQCVSFAFFATFYVWLLQKVTADEPLLIAVLTLIIVAFGYDFIRNYRNTLYALEIRNESIYIFYRGTLKATIPLNRIHHIYFFLQKQGKTTRIHPRMQVYISKKEHVLYMKLSIDNYHLLKTFLSRKRIKLIDDYTRT